MTVEFEESENSSPHYFQSRQIILGEPAVPGMIQYLLKKGIVKNERQAFIILVLIAILCLLGTAFMMFKLLYKPLPSAPALTAADQVKSLIL